MVFLGSRFRGPQAHSGVYNVKWISYLRWQNQHRSQRRASATWECYTEIPRSFFVWFIFLHVEGYVDCSNITLKTIGLILINFWCIFPKNSILIVLICAIYNNTMNCFYFYKINQWTFIILYKNIEYDQLLQS